MKLHIDKASGLNLVTGYGADHVLINRERHEGNLLVLADRIVGNWAAAGFDGLTEADFLAVAEQRPEVVLVGTGRRQRFPAPALLRPLMERRIGFEIMDLPAACRTYNVLVAERRAVALALLFDAD